MGKIYNFVNHFLPELLELIPTTVRNYFFFFFGFELWIHNTLCIELVLPQNIIP
jgi:hypothetical protein